MTIDETVPGDRVIVERPGSRLHGTRGTVTETRNDERGWPWCKVLFDGRVRGHWIIDMELSWIGNADTPELTDADLAAIWECVTEAENP